MCCGVVMSRSRRLPGVRMRRITSDNLIISYASGTGYDVSKHARACKHHVRMKSAISHVESLSQDYQQRWGILIP